MKILAPAKVNLYLSIRGLRPDGAHELETIFHAVSLYDELTVTPSRKISLQVFGKEIPKGFPAGADNIVCRAAREFFKAFKIHSGVKIALKKNIPVQAGLGGGSTDAAAVLKACAKIFLNKTGPQEGKILLKIAGNLGADVPFFLRGGCALARGKGEKLRQLPSAKFLAVIVKPQAGLSTKAVYGWYDQALAGSEPLTPAPQIRKIVRPIQLRETSGEWAGFLYNSFEDVVFRRVPEIGRTKSDLLKQGCRSALLSGSGSALFGLVKSQAEGEKVRGSFLGLGLRAWVVRSV